MALQDLTPQLRTRLSRVERAVGWFVLLAVLLLLTGFVYYVWHTAQRKGWFVEKVRFQTCVESAAGIKPGDPVKLMGFPIGKVLRITPNQPNDWYNVTIEFEVLRAPDDYIGYIWSDSRAQVTGAEFIGSRALEITKGRTGTPFLVVKDGRIVAQLDFELLKLFRTYGEDSDAVIEKYFIKKRSPAFWQAQSNNFLALVNQWRTNHFVPEAELFSNYPAPFYHSYTNGAWSFLPPDESPALTERLQKVALQVEQALPNILNLTNQAAAALSNVVQLTASLNTLALTAQPAVSNATLTLAGANDTVAQVRALAEAARPAVSNVVFITERLREPRGALGEWLIPTNINQQLDQLLVTLNQTSAHTDTNLVRLAQSLALTLDNLAGITSNLNVQVQANTNILSGLSDLVVNTDVLVQGLRRHWLLRSAFKTNALPPLKKK